MWSRLASASPDMSTGEYSPEAESPDRQFRPVTDVAHVVGQDLQLGPTGDLALVDGDGETQQRVLHRLLTSAGTYIWQLSYGAGLPGLIGSVASQQQITAIIRAQMGYEPSVAPSPEPQVALASGAVGEISATITYTDSVSGSIQILILPIGD